MKQISIFALAALTVFAACNPKHDSNDVRTFGMIGDVKAVRFSEEMLESSSAEAAEHFWADKDKLEMTFDEQGRITLDSYGTVYQYDESGVFVPETGSTAVMSRDAKGRIEAYDNTCLDDVDFSHYDISKYYKASYEYDAKGRPVRGEFAGWEWGETRTYQYDGARVYPSVIIKEGGSEGWNEKTTVTYEYTEYDARGNWTERFVTRQTDGWEACAEGVEPEIETTVIKTREIRTITYWSE